MFKQNATWAWSLLLPPPQSWAARTQRQLSVALQVPNCGSGCCKERAHTAPVRAPSSLEAAFKLGSCPQAMHPVDPDLSHSPRMDLPACPQTCLTTMKLPGLPSDPSFHHWTCPAHHTWVQEDWAAGGWSLPQPQVLSPSVPAPSSAESHLTAHSSGHKLTPHVFVQESPNPQGSLINLSHKSHNRFYFALRDDVIRLSFTRH